MKTRLNSSVFAALIFLGLCLPTAARAGELLTNAAHFSNAPPWLSMSRVNRVVDNIQRVLEWDIRRVEVVWYNDPAQFEASHNQGPLAVAVSFRDQNRVHLGPKVTEKNFDSIFGHEMAHVISFQKYKGAIPSWLEEGVANFVSKNGKVDYAWLAQQPGVQDFHDLTHPMRGNADEVRARYQASQALVEMISARCDFRNLLRLSVGQGMDGYLERFCGFKDMNALFQKWMRDKAGTKSETRASKSLIKKAR